MTKHILNATKQDFVTLCRGMKPYVFYELATTPFAAKHSELARWRRQTIKTLNNINMRKLKSGANR